MFKINRRLQPGDRSQSYRDSLQQALRYHGLVILFNQLAPHVDEIQNKQKHLIQKTYLDMVSKFSGPVMQIIGYQLARTFMTAMEKRMAGVKQKRDELTQETLLRYIGEQFGLGNRG